MFDRSVQFPQRYQLQKVAGTDDIYDIIPAPGEIQNEGTLINKSTLLTDAVASMLGFGASAVPNDMFNVLTHAGDLHVWRRTVTTTEETPEKQPTYELSGEEAGYFNFGVRGSYEFSDTVTVSNNGEVTLADPKSSVVIGNVDASGAMSLFRGKFIVNVNASGASFVINSVYFIPQTANFEGGINTLVARSVQYVTGYPYVPAVPAGTYTDYPVHPNRNAYQEGSDAQPAGYTLGPVQSGQFQITPVGMNATATYKRSTSILVSENGQVSFPTTADTYTANNFNAQPEYMITAFAGYFIQLQSQSQSFESVFTGGEIFYIPQGATMSKIDQALYLSQYQTVTGYPAIPAGTTIEYMGQVGDKARIETGSYTGNGKYGNSNPNRLAFSFPPKLVFVSQSRYAPVILCRDANTTTALFSSRGEADRDTTAAASGLGITWEENAVSYYNTVGATWQFNETGITYDYFAIG